MLAQQKQEEDNGDEFVVWNVDGTICSYFTSENLYLHTRTQLAEQ